jgi:integrase
MLKQRISQKSIIEEYKLLEGAGSLFRIRMNENWILRYKDHLQKKIIKKELNHTDFEDALSEALSVLRMFEAIEAVKMPDNIYTFSELVENFLTFQRERILNNEISNNRYTVIEIQIKKHFINFVGDGDRKKGLVTIANFFSADSMNYYPAFRSNSEKAVSSITIKNEMNSIKLFLNWCNRYYFSNEKNISFDVQFQSDKKRKKGITPLEFFRIQAALKKWPDSAINDKDGYYRRVIRDFIFIQSSFLLSFSELKNMKWEDVNLIVKDQELTARLTINTGKKSRVISAREGHLFFHIKTYSKFTDKSHYIFCDQKENTIINNNTYFYYLKKLMDELKIDKTNRNLGFDDFKTMGIVLKIKNGLSLFEIAEITGDNYINLYKKFAEGDLSDMLNKTFK